MPVETALAEQSGLRPYNEGLREKYEQARASHDDVEIELTPEEQEEFEIVRRCASLLDDARKARSPYETFDICWDLYQSTGTYPRSWPGWKARITIPRIRALITFLTAVMTDNKPKISVEPLVPGSEEAADLLSKLVDRDWQENDMQQKVSTFVLYGLIWGTAFMKITYDPYANGGRGKHIATPVVPYRVYTNRTATCIEDAEHLIQVEEQTMGWVRRNFPDKANQVYKLRGTTPTNNEKGRDRDFIREGDTNEQQRIISAQNINGNITPPLYSIPSPSYSEQDRDTVEIEEFWLRDETLESFERQKWLDGKPQFENVIGGDGLTEFEQVGMKAATSEIDGAPIMVPQMRPKQKPVMESAWRPKYPNGRLVLIAAERVLLRDIPNPYQTDGFPWAMWKDYDVGTFWGFGEAIALKDLSTAEQRLASEVYNILEKIGNPSYKVLKGAGVNVNLIKNKAGSLIPMDDLKGIEPMEKPPIPQEFFELYGLVVKAFDAASGVNDATRGQLPASNTSFAAIDQLQESGSAPIRLKVRNLETGLTRIGKLRTQLIQQFDSGQRPLRVRPEDFADQEEGVVEPPDSSGVTFRPYRPADLQGQVDFSIVPISSLSTSPVGTWNRWQEMYKAHQVDRRWFHQKMRIEGWRTELPRIEAQEAQDAKDQAEAKQSSKPGPAPKTPPGKARRGKPAPANNTPTAHDRAAKR